MLINPIFERYTRSKCPPLGILSIATYLIQNGHEVKILNRLIEVTDYNKEFDEFKPEIIGCSFLSVMPFNDAIEISTEAKRRGIYVVWGGPFVSSVPELVFQLKCLDAISIGEGEETWLDLCNTLEKGGDVSRVKGMAYLENGKVIYTPEREFTDLAKLPQINYELIHIDKSFEKRYDFDRSLPMYLSKGCPGHCTFCYNTAFHKNCRRQRPIEQVIAEAKYMKEKYKINAITFSDELFACSKENVREICNALIESGLDLNWGCMMRIGICDEEEYRLMYDAGCRWIEFGIESGSKTVIKRMKKGMNVDRVSYDVDICKELGIVVLCYIIVGFPDETEEELKQTCELVNKIQSSRIICSYFNPLPNSEIFNELVESGRFTPPKDIHDYINPPIFYSPKPNLSNVKSKDLKVVRSSMLWSSFTQKRFTKNDKNNYSLAKKDIEDIIKGLKGNGLKAGIENLFISAYEFLDIFFYANFFPITKKKYGLNKKK